jgi:phosphohistidine phosphatase
MRHAKSDWSFDLEDHDRPLNARGYTSARVLGDWLRQHGHIPDVVLCSTATRTRETLDGLGLGSPALFDRDLYLAAPETMFDILRATEQGTVLLIAHNPGIAELAHQLAASPPEHPKFAHYPTGATTVFDFDLSRWAELTRGSGQIRDFVVPRELTTA